jgi:hypothetical protein
MPVRLLVLMVLSLTLPGVVTSHAFAASAPDATYEVCVDDATAIDSYEGDEDGDGYLDDAGDIDWSWFDDAVVDEDDASDDGADFRTVAATADDECVVADEGDDATTDDTSTDTTAPGTAAVKDHRETTAKKAKAKPKAKAKKAHGKAKAKVRRRGKAAAKRA